MVRKSSLSLPPMERRKVILWAAASAMASTGCSSSRLPPPPKRNEITERAQVFDLVDVEAFVPGVFFDLRYKTRNNVLGRPLYPENMPCLLKRETALKLRRVRELVARRGFTLKIWDGWRPPEVQALFHDELGHTGLFLDPQIMWSRHCTGTAVDLTLVTERGRYVAMPTDFDEGGNRARYDGSEATVAQRQNLAILQHAMHDVGFLLIDTEWWHFDDGDFAFNQPRVVSAKDLGLILPM